MAGFDHSPSKHVEQETAVMAARNSRVGLRLFVVYLLIYAGFVYLNAFQPQWMGMKWGGISLAVTFGFGVILLAPFLALIYGWLCRFVESETSEPTPQDKGASK